MLEQEDRRRARRLVRLERRGWDADLEKQRQTQALALMTATPCQEMQVEMEEADVNEVDTGTQHDSQGSNELPWSPEGGCSGQQQQQQQQQQPWGHRTELLGLPEEHHWPKWVGGTGRARRGGAREEPQPDRGCTATQQGVGTEEIGLREEEDMHHWPKWVCGTGRARGGIRDVLQSDGVKMGRDIRCVGEGGIRCVMCMHKHRKS